jgi:hypothetical protein
MAAFGMGVPNAVIYQEQMQSFGEQKYDETLSVMYEISQN